MQWVPKTRLGKAVEKGDITTMADALETRLPVREPEIVDILLPNLEDEVLDVNMVQRMTDSGRRVRFAITTVVGNGNGFVGLGRARGKEVGPSIRKAIDNAKLNIIQVRRGCGSWECGCGAPHSLPFEVEGKTGSVSVVLKPAPRGIALAVGDAAKPLLKLAGIRDAWAFTKGHTKTTTNYVSAVFEALKNTSEMRVTKSQEEDMHIVTGLVPEQEEPIEISVMAEIEKTMKEPEEKAVKKEEAAEPPKKEEEKPKGKPEGQEKEKKAESSDKTEKKEEPKKTKKAKEPKEEGKQS